MSELWKNFAEKLGGVAGKWTAYTAFGSFVLYLLGYLALRFQLSVYGVATNLDVFDEKYLFAGCRFLVYLVSAVPSVLIIVLVLAAVGYVPYRLIPRSLKERVKNWVALWCASPSHLPLFGVVFAAVVIQLVMRRCFALSNLLLRSQLPDSWASSVLLTSDGKLALYFDGLLGCALFIGGILVFVLQHDTTTTAASRFWLGILVFLFAVAFLLLPVNYGVLISTQELPRVTDVGAIPGSNDARRVWLVWDSKEAVTYLVRDSRDQRMIVTIPKKDAQVKVVAYDDIFCVLFGANQVESRPCPRSK